MKDKTRCAKLSADALAGIDWELVAQIKQVSGQALKDIKRKVSNIIAFVLDSECNEIRMGDWIVSFIQFEDKVKLEVLFVPTRSEIYEDEKIKKELMSEDEQEKSVLLTILRNSIAEENYELSAVCHSRLKKLDKNLFKKHI